MIPIGAGLNSVEVSIPPPIGGWDTRNAKSAMPPFNAVLLDNWFPDTEKVQFRPDHTSHATGMTGAVETLIEYTALTGAAKLFAANNGNIHEVTAAGAVGAADVSGLTNNRFQQIQFGNTAGAQYALIMNGADTPRLYDGTTWANVAFTGPTVANLIWCATHHRKLFFGEKDSASFWYLAANATTGLALEFSLRGVFTRGGHIMAMGTWSRDSGEGMDDFAVFFSSEGEVAVYSGIDPGNAADWLLVGVYRIGRPIGRRCMLKYGSDLVLVTEDGFVTTSSVLTVDRAASENTSISKQIHEAFNLAVRSFSTLFGWQPFLYPKGRMLMVNIPISSSDSHQYVFNTLTGAPCRFKDIKAACWGLIGDTAYLGDYSGVVHKFDTGAKSDNGTAILGDMVPAFSYFGSPGQNKAFKLAEPVFESVGAPNAAIDMLTDFELRAFTGVTSQSTFTSATWGVSKWGVGTWGADDQVFKDWRGIRGIGKAGALQIRVQTSVSRPSLISTNIIFMPGGLI